ncbi:hypothetical protein quinque_015063 [Culex quinquefasciatus]
MSLGVEIFDLPARHFQVFWGASGDLWQSLWDRVLDVTVRAATIACANGELACQDDYCKTVLCNFTILKRRADFDLIWSGL